LIMTETTARIPITVKHCPAVRGFRHSMPARWVATYGSYPHDIEATGKTEAEAKANLTAALLTALEVITTHEPVFGRDDDGALLAAVPAADGGSRHWRITDTAWCGTVTSSPAAEAFADCYHQTVIPRR